MFRYYSESTKNKALKLYKEGFSCQKAADSVGCTVKTAWDWAKEAGILRLPLKTDPDYHRKYRKRNKKRIKQYNKIYGQKNRIQRREYNRTWRAKNRERDRLTERTRIENTPGLKFSRNISCLINYSLKGNKNGHHWETLVGYTLSELKDHLERQFLKNMNWSNHGRDGWHVDHRIPISAFNFTCADDPGFKHCWALSNLQPLWEKDNLKKGNKIA